MIVIATRNGNVGIRQAVQVLRDGGSAIDAVEEGIHHVESNPDDHGVGLGGTPNLLGEVELDATIMDGATLQAGAVGAVKGYAHPISIARKVMEELWHVFLVGAGAERFAAEMGFEKTALLTDYVRTGWQTRLGEDLGICDPAQLQCVLELRHIGRLAGGMSKVLGTVNFIARDGRNNICSGVSTSGLGLKYPGRLADSAVIGAGNYADNRYGAAVCTGMGEMAIRAGTARSTVLYMKMGMSVEEACKEAIQDLDALIGDRHRGIHLIAMDREGNHYGAANYPDRTKHIYMTGEMDDFAYLEGYYAPFKTDPKPELQPDSRDGMY